MWRVRGAGVIAAVGAVAAIIGIAFGATPALSGASKAIRSAVPDGALRETASIARFESGLSFEINQGQADPRIDFLAHGRGYSLLLTAAEAIIRRDGARQAERAPAPLHMKLLGTNSHPLRAALDVLPGKVNYFIGRDPARWHHDVPTYARVSYGGIYPGIDVIYYGSNRELEYDFVVAPRADPGVIALEIDGTIPVSIDQQGDLVLRDPDETLVRLKRPIAYQDAEDGRREVQVAYRLDGRRLSFRIGAYDSSKPLVIDPVLSYATRLGGTDGDAVWAIGVGPENEIYVAGESASTDLPTTKPYQRKLSGSTDVFVAKLSPDGSQVLYATYIGGHDADVAYGVAVDKAGSAYITGDTRSTDFPLVRPWQPKLAGTADVFVAKLSPDGARLQYSSYFGGSSGERGLGIAVDKAGQAYVTGYTHSVDLPVIKPFQGAFAGGNADAFVLKVGAEGAGPVYATYLGGGNDRPDIATAIAADADGNAYVTGFTNSPDFPTLNPMQKFIGPTDAFVTKLSPDGSALVYSTHLGGTADDEAMGIAVDPAGSVYVTGQTESPNFPVTAGAFRTRCTAVPSHLRIGDICSGGDAFVSKLSSDGSMLLYSTFLNGTGFEVGRSIAVDQSGNAHVTGLTNSRDFPLVNPIQDAFGGGAYDAFAVKLNSTGSALIYSTYLGGAGDDGGYGVAIGSEGDAWIGGYTTSQNFPLRRPLPGARHGGDKDGFVARIADRPLPHH